MTIEQTFIQKTYQKLSETILNFDPQLTDDIYVISFWYDAIEDDLRKPTVVVGYNTIQQWKSCTPLEGQTPKYPIASDSDEAKWNFAFWLQNNEATIGGEEPTFQEWIKQLPFYYTNEKLEQDFDSTLELGGKIQERFMDIIIQLSMKLHTNGIIKQKFGKDIPILLHELEYYDLPLSRTKKANPPGLIIEFENWINSMK